MARAVVPGALLCAAMLALSIGGAQAAGRRSAPIAASRISVHDARAAVHMAFERSRRATRTVSSWDITAVEVGAPAPKPIIHYATFDLVQGSVTCARPSRWNERRCTGTVREHSSATSWTATYRFRAVVRFRAPGGVVAQRYVRLRICAQPDCNDVNDMDLRVWYADRYVRKRGIYAKTGLHVNDRRPIPAAA